MALLKSNDEIKLYSRKEESTDSLVTYIKNNYLQATARPSKPELTTFIVHQNDDGTYMFEMKAAGGFLTSDLPSCAVIISRGKPSDIDTAKWRLFTKISTGELSDVLTQLDRVWLQNVKTAGFLSARSNELWTTEGRLWTRNQYDKPTGAHSWECFSLKFGSHIEPRDLQKENVQLQEELREARLQIQKLKQEIVKLEEYKSVMGSLKKLLSEV